MAVFTDEIYAATRSYGADESEALKELCAAAEDLLRRRIKEGTAEVEYETVLKQAAAMMALSMFYTVAASGGEVSYTAGAVSVSVKNGHETVKNAQYLRKQAEEIMAPFINDGGFAFMEVRG